MENASKAEDWLPVLQWAFELFTNPSPARILESFESWEHRNRLRGEFRRLERAKYVERRGPREHQTLHLTPRGRLQAWGGVDPRQRWQRPWDGQWRMLIFDLPIRSQTPRIRLWRWLRARRFGLLQRSVWVTPDKVARGEVPLLNLQITPTALSVIEGRPTEPDSNLDLVGSAWDFVEINQRYQTVLDWAAKGRELASARNAEASEVRQWLASERLAWEAALEVDPLLPEALLPPDYLGRQAWDQRQAVYGALAKGANKGM